MKIRITVTIIMALVLVNKSFSQDLLDILEFETSQETQFIPATFNMTRIAIGHSTEVRSKGILEVFVANRFWNLPLERSQSFIADRMSSRLALEYAISDNLTFGAGSTTFDGLFDAHLKYRIPTKSGSSNVLPFRVTLFQNFSYNSSPIANQGIADDFSDRTAFTSQILLSKKVSKDFSLQIAPTYVNKKLGLQDNDSTNFFAFGVGGRYKIGSHLSIVSEYYHTFNPVESFNTYNPFAIGANWELGDIMLQFMLTNAVNMVEDTFITQTRNNFNFRNPNLNFGFNATYVFHFKNKLKEK
ncbi:DUF5777 family beta-barrel protein [Croceitalea rosinachiae]|uniref:DUF5777 family beta-barrel protein n=1 Tax=Croceitalea rosinachiae TaxID=3075596 RepID=A0ABU3AF92_9FLAO|nr:DUF5777 family beta-barrel protein [Croceitalea sp. F388]MDT0607768.1 DUF5777 family beta-barrel protein [Croceitalea sp. F388]